MIEIKITGYEGPRSPQSDEIPAVLELSRSIFFKDAPTYQEGAKRWPMALHDDWGQNHYVMLYNGQPVSTIGRLERDILVRGHRLRMGFIGGVCTHPDHRGKGLASIILQASLAKFREHDVDVVYISGARPLYYGIGATHIGGFTEFVIPGDGLSAYLRQDVILRDATPEDIILFTQLNETEGVRFVRPIRDYELCIAHGYCSGKPCTFRLIEMNSKPVGYIIVTRPTEKEPNKVRVLEYAGERLGILAVLPRLAQEVNGTVNVTVPTKDVLVDLFTSAGLAGQPGRTGGTVKLLDFDRTMRKLLPYFAEHLPSNFVRSLAFSAASGKYCAWSDKEVLEIEGETNMLRLLLGCPPNESLTGVRVSEGMRPLVQLCLPLPLPHLAMNTI